MRKKLNKKTKRDRKAVKITWVVCAMTLSYSVGFISLLSFSLLSSPPNKLKRDDSLVWTKGLFLIIAIMLLTAEWLTMRQLRGAWSTQLISCRTIVNGGFHSCTHTDTLLWITHPQGRMSQWLRQILSHCKHPWMEISMHRNATWLRDIKQRGGKKCVPLCFCLSFKCSTD